MKSRFFLALAAIFAGVPALATARAEACDGPALYENMVRAKGGRERLHEVHALYAHWRLRYWNWEKFRVITEERRTLYLFPDFLWAMSDIEPFGKESSTVDLSTGTVKTMLEGRKHVEVEPVRVGTALAVAQAEWLIESRWWKPEVLGCFEETYEGVASWVVRVAGSGLEFEYFIEKGKDLPWMVRRKAGQAEYLRGLFHYKSVNGLMMPTFYRVVDKYNGRVFFSYGRKLRFEINPDYDPRVRKWDPTIEGDPEPWRRKRSR